MTRPDEDVPGSGRQGWALVAGQFVLLGVLVIEVPRTRHRLGTRGAFGLGAAVAGGAAIALGSEALGRRLRAHPAPPTDAVLRTDGAYGVVRHPIYFGLLLIAAGAALIARTPRAVIACGALGMLLHVKIRLEERLLTAWFPDYAAYAQRVPRLVPRLPDRED